MGDLLMAPDSRMVDPFLQSPLKVWDALCTTPKSHLLAEIIPSFPANATLTARNADLKGNPIANRKAINLRPNANYHTGGLMPKGQRSAGAEVAIGKFLVIAHIRSAYAGGLNLDLKFACGRFFDISVLLLIGQTN